jgi:hypothetical protein
MAESAQQAVQRRDEKNRIIDISTLSLDTIAEMRILLPAFTLILVGACSGVQTADQVFVAHAESVAILGMEFPKDDLAAAEAMVPEGAEIESIRSVPDDWTSLSGILNNILGIHMTEISGVLDGDQD